MYPDGFARRDVKNKIADFRTSFKASNVEMQTSTAFPMMPERILADARIALPDDAIITTDVGWNKNGVGQQFDILTPGSDPDARRFCDDGFRPSSGDWRQACCP